MTSVMRSPEQIEPHHQRGEREVGVPAMTSDMITRIGIVGAGQMGRGIAQVCAMAGYHVELIDVMEPQLKGAIAKIRVGLERAVERGALATGRVEEVLALIHPSTTLDRLDEVHLVIEAIPENQEQKQTLFAELGRICRPDTVLASNTSSIPITKLGAVSGRADRVVGLHFMNPAPVMNLVEVVRGLNTSDETVALALDVAKHLGKTPVVANDVPGFIVNRVLMPMINEAIFALEQGVASAEAIDRAMTAGANHPVGPLALADRIGLDTVLAICEVLHRELGDPKFRPCPLLRRYVEAGWLGRKTGRGFYLYDEAGERSTVAM
ncbi:MAG: 3-hydroxyacyl-CoA dehydrogenase NAD-binding domain-containing protein [Nitrospira sp.]|nr:3-hydroxyacyl-CoA dehydrogenase NAD-binding domain-containing protein [Nitrospira sp.]